MKTIRNGKHDTKHYSKSDCNMWKEWVLNVDCNRHISMIQQENVTRDVQEKMEGVLSRVSEWVLPIPYYGSRGWKRKRICN
jgi:hypothetical protein